MKYILKILGMLILLGCWSSCTKDLTGEEQADGGPMTRSNSLNTTDYYWYRGEKIGLNQDNNKKYVLFAASDRTTLSQTIGVQFVETPQALALSAKIKPLASNASSVSTSMPDNELMWPSYLH